MTEWEQLAADYQALAAIPFSAENHERMRTLIGKAASTLPKDTPSDLEWFISALEHNDKKWFVAKVMALSSPMPRTLLEPMLISALLEHNPSANRQFIEPCVKAFGNEVVTNKLQSLAKNLSKFNPKGLSQALYWIPGGRT